MPNPSRPIRPLLFAAAILTISASQALADDADLYGQPSRMQRPASSQAMDGWRQGWRDAPPTAPDPAAPGPDDRRGWRRRGEHASAGGGECWAQVKYAAQYAPPPSGPEYVWTRQPGPPGSPGPIWCLTVQPMPGRPVMTSPERYGWVRVLCNDQATAPRIAGLQRRLHARGLYRGRIDGRYDGQTAYAVRRFQDERHISHHGYLSYETVEALEGPPQSQYQPRPEPVAYRQLTTFDTGYIDWPGKVRY